MAINGLKCAAASMVIRACGQQTIKGPQAKGCDYEKKARCQEFRMNGSGGGDGDERTMYERRKNAAPDIKTKGTQTDYRENETQTLPWEAPYKVLRKGNENPEVLSLAHTTWGKDLPAGMHEVHLIKRMRMKKAWLETLPPMDSIENIKTCETIMAAIEANEWAFREAELQFIMDSRMELMDQITENRAREKEAKIDEAIERFTKRLGQQRDKQIHDIRGKFLRDVRKLNRKHRGSSAASYKRHKSDIIARYADPTSQMYAPEMRFGFNEGHRHEILNKSRLPEAYVNKPVRVNDLRKSLPTNDQLHEFRSISRLGGMCRRRTRWTDDKMRQLHADLKAIRLNDMNHGKKVKITSLLKRKFKIPPLPVTPLINRGENDDNHLERCSLFIQKITRGRAIQCMMFEGRARCRELIEELRSTHSLHESEESNRDTSIVAQSREQNERFMQENRLSEILDSLEGMTVAGMLDMLSKEETRLREERRAHAFALLAERERNRREAEESGRRQFERNRRRELDEMFRQMVKVNQDSVETYLEDIFKEGIDWITEDEARKYVEDLADKIDASTIAPVVSNSDPKKDEEMIASMVHNFLLPEVEKQMIRKKIREKQKGYLREAHATIHNEIMNLKSMGGLKKPEEMSEIFYDEEEEEEEEGEEEEEEEESEEDEQLASAEDAALYDEINLISSENFQGEHEISDTLLPPQFYPEPDEQEREDESTTDERESPFEISYDD